MRKRICKDDQMHLIMECRQSAFLITNSVNKKVSIPVIFIIR